MKIKKVILLVLLIFILAIIYIVLYNKTYHIDVEMKNVYEIQIKTLDPYQEKILTDVEDIKNYLETVQKLQFTHPTFFTGKGWETDVTIKFRNNNGANTQYRYSITNNYIQKGSFRYKLILQ
jgi:preprotein translocase subunit SecF